MPDYATPFGRLGAVGGSLLGGLGRILEPLDYPRQALWNMPGKIAQGDWVGALPGLLGAGAGIGLGATGMGVPLALLGASAVGGASQGLGKAVDEDRFQAPTGDDAIKAIGGDPDSLPGKAGSMLLQALGDPLTYAGGFGGHKAGANFGKNLEDVALTRGPRYPGGTEKLADLMGKSGAMDARLADIGQSPELSRILGEIPPGTKPLGIGAEAMAFKTPEGGVIRIAGGDGTYNVRGHLETGDGWENAGVVPSPRVKDPLMLQPARDIPIGPYRLEHVPFVDVAGGQVGGIRPGMHFSEADIAAQELSKAAEERGLLDTDIHNGNVGRTAEGKYVVSDPGSLAPPLGSGPQAERINQATGGRFKNWLLDMLGADESVRNEISQGIARGGAGEGIPIEGLRERTEALLNGKTGPLLKAEAPAAPPLQPARQVREVNVMPSADKRDVLRKIRGWRDKQWNQALELEKGGQGADNLKTLEKAQQDVNNVKRQLGIELNDVATPAMPFVNEANALQEAVGGIGDPSMKQQLLAALLGHKTPALR